MASKHRICRRCREGVPDALLISAARVPGGNGARKRDGKMRLPWEGNCHSYVAASLPGLLVAEAFQRRNEFRAAQAPWHSHACITSSRT